MGKERHRRAEWESCMLKLKPLSVRGRTVRNSKELADNQTQGDSYFQRESKGNALGSFKCA